MVNRCPGSGSLQVTGPGKRRGGVGSDPSATCAPRARWAEGLESARLGIARRPLRFLSVALALAAAAALFAAFSLRMHVDIDSMISAELPHQQRWLEFSETEPLLAHPLVVVVDGPPGETSVAAGRLAQALRERDDLFAEISAPGSDPFFRRNGLLYLPEAEFADLYDRLLAAQPLLARIADEPTLAGLFDTLDHAVARRESLPADDFAPLLDALARDLSAEASRGGWAPRFIERMPGAARAGGDGREIVLALPRGVVDDGLEGMNPASRGIAAIHAAAAEAGLGRDSPFRVRVTGDLALSADELELLRDDAWTAGLLSFALVTSLLWLGLRDLRLVLAVCGALAVGLAWTAGFAALTVGRLNMISVAFAVMSIGLGADFGIHLCARYREQLRRGATPAEALRVACRETPGPLLLCASTTAVAFFSFMYTDFTGLAEFGWISGAGILLSLVATLVVLPASIALLRPKLRWKHPRAQPALDALFEAPGRYPSAIVGAAGLAALGAVALLPGLEFTGNPLALRVQESESASTFRDLLENRGDTTWNLHLYAEDAASARQLAAEFEALDGVARARTLESFVPAKQPQRLAELTDLSQRMGSLEVPPAAPEADERFEALAEFAEDLDCGAPEGEGAVFAAACGLRATLAARLAAVGDSGESDPGLARDEARLMEPLRRRIEALAAALAPSAVTVEGLPSSLRSLWRNQDGQWRVEVSPASAFESDADVAAFADGVREIAPEATGMAVQVVESERVVVRSLYLAFALAALGITAILALRWRRPREVIYVLAPLGLSALWLLGASSLLGLPLNFANVIVLPLILGIGIDSGVHMVDRARHSPGTAQLLRSSTAQAILLSALTTLASFACLALSPHPGMASMGKMLVLGVAITLVSNLVFLPALLALGTRKVAPAWSSAPAATRASDSIARCGLQARAERSR